MFLPYLLRQYSMATRIRVLSLRKFSGLELIHPLVQEYAEKFSSREDGLLQEIAGYTLQNHEDSHMLSGHLQGKLLEMISCMVKPRRILEIGTFTGYSAVCLAKGLTDDGFLHTIELREKDAATARAFFRPFLIWAQNNFTYRKCVRGGAGAQGNLGPGFY